MGPSHSPVTIGLLGPWGSGNLGCATTQDAMIQNIHSRIPEAQIFGFSLNPADTEAKHGIPSFHLSRANWSEYTHQQKSISERIGDWMHAHPSPVTLKMELWVRRLPLEIGLIIQTYRHLKDFDLFIISGGGQLLDYWGKAWKQPYWLFKYALLSKLAGTKFMFVSVGAGPIDGKISKLFIRAALFLASYRSYRDEDSKKYIERVLGFKKHDPVYPDLAYSIKLNGFQKTGSGRIVVGVGVMPYFDPRGWPENDPIVYQTYLDKIASFVTWLVNQGYGINLLIGETIADRLVVKDLTCILKKAGVMSLANGQVKEEHIQSVSDLFCQISNTDFVVASRFHNVLLSTILNKPVIAISYHAKIDSLMKNSGQLHYCLPICQFTVETLKERFNDLQADCESIQKQFEELTRVNRIALDEQYDRIFANL